MARHIYSRHSWASFTTKALSLSWEKVSTSGIATIFIAISKNTSTLCNKKLRQEKIYQCISWTITSPRALHSVSDASTWSYPCYPRQLSRSQNLWVSRATANMDCQFWNLSVDGTSTAMHLFHRCQNCRAQTKDWDDSFATCSSSCTTLSCQRWSHSRTSTKDLLNASSTTISNCIHPVSFSSTFLVGCWPVRGSWRNPKTDTIQPSKLSKTGNSCSIFATGRYVRMLRIPSIFLFFFWPGSYIHIVAVAWAY